MTRKPQPWFIPILFCTLALLPLKLLGESPTQPTSSVNAAKPAAPAKTKLTPEQQRGFKLLKAARAEAAGYEPAMRSAVLWRISSGYLQLDKPQAIALLKEAYRAAASADAKTTDARCFIDPPDGCQPKHYLQLQILTDLVSVSPEDAEQLLPEVDARHRNYMAGFLIHSLIEQKKLEHAEELLMRMESEDDFPYDSAVEYMLALKTADQRLEIFNLALRNYRTFGDPQYVGNAEDLATMVIRFWEHLPASSVLEAIDLLLDNAKTDSEKSEDNHVSFASKNGNVTFSLYEYRLFSLVPVLRELDAARAESLVREHEEVRSSLKQYPQGLKSLYPVYRDTPASKKEEEEGLFPAVSSGNPQGDLAAQQSNDQWQLQMFAEQNEIRSAARRDPKQALQAALALPLWGPMGPGIGSPRARGLENVAEITAKKDPETTYKALDELRKVLEEYKPRGAAHYLLDIIDDYLAMGDKERAAKTIDEAGKVAERLYAVDTDSSNPNLALKAVWPSTAFWQKLVMTSSRISPQLPEQLMSQISDAEMRTLQKAAYGLALVNAKKLTFPVIEWHKSGPNSTASDF